MIKIFDTKTWWIVRGDYVSFGVSDAGTQIGTPNDTIEEYGNETEWAARLLELGVDIEALEVQNENI